MKRLWENEFLNFWRYFQGGELNAHTIVCLIEFVKSLGFTGIAV